MPARWRLLVLSLAMLLALHPMTISSAQPSLLDSLAASADPTANTGSAAARALLFEQPAGLWANAVAAMLGQSRTMAWHVLAGDLLNDSTGVTDVAAFQAVLAGVPRRVDSNMQAMMDCMNAKHVPGTSGLTWDEAMGDKAEAGSIRALAAFWSGKQWMASATLVTSASVNRIPQLYAQCKTWPGPLSVVLYQPLFQPTTSSQLTPTSQAILRAAVLQIARFMIDMEHMPKACKPDVLLVYEVFTDQRASKMLFPINTLRNLAKIQARTPLVALMDIDLVVSRGLAGRLLNQARVTDLIQRAGNNTVFVVPAFDVKWHVDRAAWADALVSSDKDTLSQAYNSRLVFQFDARGFPRGHGPTDYPRWFAAKADYPVKYQSDFEPWVVGPRLAMPMYDVRYWGYGYNKIQYIAALDGVGFNFAVLHDAFTVHRAHSQAEATRSFLRDQRNKRNTAPNLYTHNIKLYQDQCALHQQHQPFVPPKTPAIEHCLAVLPWWQGWQEPEARAAPQPAVERLTLLPEDTGSTALAGEAGSAGEQGGAGSQGGPPGDSGGEVGQSQPQDGITSSDFGSTPPPGEQGGMLTGVDTRPAVGAVDAQGLGGTVQQGAAREGTAEAGTPLDPGQPTTAAEGPAVLRALVQAVLGSGRSEGEGGTATVDAAVPGTTTLSASEGLVQAGGRDITARGQPTAEDPIVMV